MAKSSGRGNRVPVEVWLLIHELLPQTCCNPLVYLDLAKICRSARTAFQSDAVWRDINPYGLDSGIYNHFTTATTVLNPIQLKHLRQVWEFARGKVVDGPDTVLYKLYKQEIPGIESGENDYYNLGLVLSTIRLIGQPRLNIVPLSSKLMQAAVKLNPNVQNRLDNSKPVYRPTLTRAESGSLVVAGFSVYREEGDPIDEMFLDRYRTRESAIEALGDGVELEHIPERLRDRSLVEYALRHDGTNLRFCSREQKQDPELVKIALTESGYALQYAHDSLRQENDMVLRARCSFHSVTEEQIFEDPFYDQFAANDPYIAIVNEMNKKMGLPALESDGLKYYDFNI